MSIEVSVAIAVFIFAVLAVFIIITLVRTNQLLKELQNKSKRLDSLMNAVSNLGEVCEKQTNQFKSNCLDRKVSVETSNNYYPEIATLVLLGLKLGEKILKNR